MNLAGLQFEIPSQQIIQQVGNHVLSLKGNQGSLQEDASIWRYYRTSPL